MKALILAAGLGTRLRPLTDVVPKALIPVGGKPMLERIIVQLKESGFTDITLNIHYLGDQILDFLHAHENFGTTIHISDERKELLDTGGGIRKARPFLDGNEPFLVYNADILSDVNLTALYQHHKASHTQATLLVSKRKTSRYLLLDNSLRLNGWINKTTGEVNPADVTPSQEGLNEWAFGGIHVISPTLFQYMKDEKWNGKFSIISFYLSICREVPIEGYPLQNSQWFDIGKPETLALAEKSLR